MSRIVWRAALARNAPANYGDAHGTDPSRIESAKIPGLIILSPASRLPTIPSPTSRLPRTQKPGTLLEREASYASISRLIRESPSLKFFREVA